MTGYCATSRAYRDSKHGIIVFSLSGDVRRPTTEMLDTLDALLFDLEDVGWRGYTWVATLLYMLEACAARGIFPGTIHSASNPIA